MEQDHSRSRDNPSIVPLQHQPRFPNSIVSNDRNYFRNDNKRNFLSMEELEAEVLRLRLLSSANISNNGHNAYGHNFFQSTIINHHPLGAPNVHAQSSRFRSSTMGIEVDYRLVGPRNYHGYRHGRGIGSMRMNNESDCDAILKLVKDGSMSETQIIELIKDRLPALMFDRVGNSFVQRLLGFCYERLINYLLLFLISHDDLFLDVCLHEFGHRTLVKLMDHVRFPYQQSPFASAISCHAVTLAKTSRGGHEVLKRCFLKFSRQDNELILLRIAQSSSELARDQAGCCILQVCIEYAIEEVREALISPLIQDAEGLSMNAYGNYVLQFIIKLDEANVGPRIIKELKNKFVELSMNKYGSNVVENCISCCEGQNADEIIYELMENVDNQVRLCSHRFGNYVVQKALSLAKEETLNFLIEVIQNHWLDLQFHLYGKNVTDAVKRLSEMS